MQEDHCGGTNLKMGLVFMWLKGNVSNGTMFLPLGANFEPLWGIYTIRQILVKILLYDITRCSTTQHTNRIDPIF
jgi:hypothetical protein